MVAAGADTLAEGGGKTGDCEFANEAIHGGLSCLAKAYYTLLSLPRHGGFFHKTAAKTAPKVSVDDYFTPIRRWKFSVATRRAVFGRNPPKAMRILSTRLSYSIR